MPNSLIEPPFVPAWGKAFQQSTFFIYNGASMTPLFCPGDILCVQKTDLTRFCIGDIAVINWGNKAECQYVVHRVVEKRVNGFVTQGDNNLKLDTELLTTENLVGKVICYGRKGKVRPARGGMAGLLFLRLIFTRNLLWLLIKRLGWRIYRLIRKSGWIAKFWHPAIQKIQVKTDDGLLIKYCYHNRSIARWRLDINKFEVVKPFDLVIPPPEESK